MSEVRVLLVEPDGDLRRATARALRDHFEITQAHAAGRALELIREAEFDVVIAHVETPRLEGLALIDRLRVERHRLAQHCVVLSGDVDAIGRGARERSIELLAAPARISDLVIAIRRAADR